MKEERKERGGKKKGEKEEEPAINIARMVEAKCDGRIGLTRARAREADQKKYIGRKRKIDRWIDRRKERGQEKKEEREREGEKRERERERLTSSMVG